MLFRSKLQEMEKKLALNMDIIKCFTLVWKSKLSVISSLAKKKRVPSDIVRPFTFAKLWDTRMTYRLFVMRPKNIWTLFSKCQVISSCGVAASAGVVGSPFAPNEVPAPVCAAALTESRYHVRSAHEIFKVRFP